MVHRDYPYTPKLIPAMVAIIGKGLYHCVLGSRILGGYAIRHLTASILCHKGYDVSGIRAILRHKSPTTNRYLKRLGLDETKAALEEGLAGPAKVIDFRQKKKAVGVDS